MITKKILERARELLLYGWCKKALARSASNQYCPTYSFDAKCFCLYGALDRAAKEYDVHEYSRFRLILELVLAALPEGFNRSSISNIANYNDACDDVYQVVEVLDRCLNEVSKMSV